jgi:hypothetical protein
LTKSLHTGTFNTLQAKLARNDQVSFLAWRGMWKLKARWNKVITCFLSYLTSITIWSLSLLGLVPFCNRIISLLIMIHLVYIYGIDQIKRKISFGSAASFSILGSNRA